MLGCFFFLIFSYFLMAPIESTALERNGDSFAFCLVFYFAVATGPAYSFLFFFVRANSRKFVLILFFLFFFCVAQAISGRARGMQRPGKPCGGPVAFTSQFFIFFVFFLVRP